MDACLCVHWGGTLAIQPQVGQVSSTHTFVKEGSTRILKFPYPKYSPSLDSLFLQDPFKYQLSQTLSLLMLDDFYLLTMLLCHLETILKNAVRWMNEWMNEWLIHLEDPQCCWLLTNRHCCGSFILGAGVTEKNFLVSCGQIEPNLLKSTCLNEIISDCVPCSCCNSLDLDHFSLRP